MELAPHFQRFLTGLFDELAKRRISVFVARGGNELPARIDGNDLDIFVAETELEAACSILINTITRNKLQIIHTHKRSYFLAIWIADGHDTAALHIDLYPGMFTWKGLPYLEDGEVCKGIRLVNGIPYPSPVVDLLGLLLTSLLWGGFIKYRYLPRIQAILVNPENVTETKRYLKERFGNDGHFLQSVQDGSITGANIRRLSCELRTGLLKKSFNKHPFETCNRVFKYIAGEIKARTRPPGLCIALLGPDGAGKSLLSRRIVDRLNPLFGETKVFHWRPEILPEIGVLLGKRRKVQDVVVSDPHSKPSHGITTSLIRVLYYLADYYLGWLLTIWPSKARNHLVVFDRYAIDMWIDPRRYRLDIPSLLLRTLCRLVPQPDLSIVLTATPAVLLSRKQEVSQEELCEILGRLKYVADYDSDHIEVDCTPPVEDVAKACEKIIREKMLRRHKERYSGIAG